MSSDKRDVYSPYKAAYHIDSIQDLRDGKLPSPKHVQLILSDYCQMSCRFCSYRAEEGMSSELFVERDETGKATNINPNRFIPKEKIIEILDDCKEMGVKAIQFSVLGTERIPIIENGITKTIEIGKFVDSQFNTEYKKGYQQKSIRGIKSFSIDDFGNLVEDEITKVYRHRSIEPLLRVTLLDGRHLTVTKSHSLISFKEGKMQKTPVGELNIDDELLSCDWHRTKVGRPRKLKIDIDPSKLNRVNLKKPSLNKLKYSPEFARMLGYYTAEGSSSQINHLVWTFGNGPREERYIADLSYCIKKCFGMIPRRNDRYAIDNNGKEYLQSVQIDLASKVVQNFFNEIGATGKCQVKSVPFPVWNFTNDLKVQYLIGFYSGDGNFRSTPYKNGKFNRNVLATGVSSKSLVDDLYALIKQLGCTASSFRQIIPERIIEGRKLPSTICYKFNISNKKSLEILIDVVKALDGKLQYKNSKYSNFSIRLFPKFGESERVKIKKIEVIDERPMVYDITVGNTHRFIMSNCMVSSNTGGGDPSASPHFKEALEATLDRNLDMAVVTHGAHIKDDVPELLSRGQWVRFSIDAGTPESYEYIRQVKPGTMQKTLSNIRRVVAARDQNPDSELVIGCGFVVTKDNYKEVVEAAKIISDLGVDNMRISAMFQKDNFNYFKPFYDEAKDLVAQAEEYSRSDFKVINLFGNRIQDLIDESPNFKECYYASMTTYIGADLGCYMCCTTSYTKHGMQGSLKFQSFKDFWESEARQNFHKLFDSKSCENCMFLDRNRLLHSLIKEPKHSNFV